MSISKGTPFGLQPGSADQSYTKMEFPFRMVLCFTHMETGFDPQLLLAEGGGCRNNGFVHVTQLLSLLLFPTYASVSLRNITS